MSKEPFTDYLIRLTKKDREIERALLIGMGIGFIMMLSVTAVILLGQWTYYSTTISSMESQHEKEIEELHQSYKDASKDKDELLEQMTTEVETLESRMEEIASNGEVQMALLQKFNYVIQEAPADGGVTAEIIQYADQVSKEKNINPHLVWAMIDHESSYRVISDNANSSARGLGQFLASTAERFYEDFLGHGEGSYDHVLAYDPYINIDLITEYLSYLRDTNNGDARMMMRLYSGSSDDNYYNAIASEMRAVGESIDVVNYK